MWLVSLFAIVLSFIRIGAGDDLFIFPTAPGPNELYVADLLWTVGSTQEIQWVTSSESYDIVLWQQAIGQDFGRQLNTVYTTKSNGAGQFSFNWQVQTYGSNLSSSPVYFLWLVAGSTLNFTSHYFNITERAQSSSSSSPSTAFTSSTSSATSTIASSTLSTPQKSSDTTSVSPASTSPATASPASDSSSTETVKVGLGVGLGIGLPLVLIAGIWIGLKSVQQRKSSSRATSSDVPLSQFPNNKYPYDSYPPPNEAMYYGNLIHEAPGRNDERHEAPGERDLIELGS